MVGGVPLAVSKPRRRGSEIGLGARLGMEAGAEEEVAGTAEELVMGFLPFRSGAIEYRSDWSYREEE